MKKVRFNWLLYLLAAALSIGWPSEMLPAHRNPSAGDVDVQILSPRSYRSHGALELGCYQGETFSALTHRT